jgi:hypothetical protein
MFRWIYFINISYFGTRLEVITGNVSNNIEGVVYMLFNLHDASILNFVLCENYFTLIRKFSCK